MTTLNALNRAFRNALPGLTSGLQTISQRCAAERCRARGRFLPFGMRSEGTQIGADWYCGPKCFEEAALQHLVELYTQRSHNPISRKPRMPMGLTALSLGHITPEQLQASLRHHQEKHVPIGQAMLELGFANQAQVTAALAAQWGYPVLSLQGRGVNMKKHLPMRLVEKYSMLPVHFIEKTNKLVVGFAQMVEHRILATIENMLGCGVIPCFITPEDFAGQFKNLQVVHQDAEDEVVFEQRATLPEIARITRSYAWQTGALNARFGICSEYLWSRLEGPRTAVDILTKI